jgi:hypothetical protein
MPIKSLSDLAVLIEQLLPDTGYSYFRVVRQLTAHCGRLRECQSTGYALFLFQLEPTLLAINPRDSLQQILTFCISP